MRRGQSDIVHTGVVHHAVVFTGAIARAVYEVCQAGAVVETESHRLDARLEQVSLWLLTFLAAEL